MCFMRRTIQIGDKYKDMIEKYELELDKEEFNMLITKLLKANQDLQNKNMDIFLVCELIDKYNLDFYSLINIFSSYSINTIGPNKEPIQITNQQENQEKKEILKETPIIDFNNPVKTKTKENSNNILEDNINTIKSKKSVKDNLNKININDKEINMEDSFDNPILSLGIDLS